MIAFAAFALLSLTRAEALLSTPADGTTARGTTVGETTVGWKGRSHELSKLPGALESARPAIEAWAGWAADQSYRLDVGRAGNVLILSPEDDAQTAAWLAIVDDTVRLFDRRLPEPDRSGEAETGGGGAAPAATDPETIPEDPLGDEPLFDDVAVAPPTWGTAWGAGARGLGEGAICLFVLRDAEDYSALLAELAERRDYLAEWTEEARAVTGFAIGDPLCGAFLLNAAGMEEWDPGGELCHRLAHLLVLWRFGEQPYWVLKGWAWHAELEVRGGIFCFPYRSGFVGIEEHSGWGPQLAARFGSRGAPPGIEDLAGLQRGAWDDAGAAAAWGAVTFLVGERREALVRALEDLRKTWDRENRTLYPDGTWERDRGWKMPLEQQREVLLQAAGSDLFDALEGFFLAGAR